MRKMLLGLLVLGMAGCNAGKQWHKPGVTQQDFFRDKVQCRALAVQGSAGNMFAEFELFSQCMVGFGWRLQSPSSSLPTSSTVNAHKKKPGGRLNPPAAP